MVTAFSRQTGGPGGPPSISRSVRWRIGLYRKLLSESFEQLHPHLRVAHEAPLRAIGVAEVRGADNFVGALVGRLMSFPRPGSGVPVALEVYETADGTRWERRFGGGCVRTLQKLVEGYMVEHRGVGQLWFSVRVEDGDVLYTTVQARLFGITLPMPLTPRATGLVTPTEDGWQTQIEVSAPLLGVLCAYSVRMFAKT